MRPESASVIGCGRFGPHLARNLREAGLDVVVHDRNLHKAKTLAARLAVCVADLNRALTTDLVVVATPPGSHADLAMRALENGAHVIVEKPMTLDLPSAQALVATADAAARVLAVDHTPLFEPGVQGFLAAIPKLGHLQRLRAVRHLQHSGPHVDALWDLAPHDLAVLDGFITAPLTGEHESIEGRIGRSRLKSGVVELDVGWGIPPRRTLEAWGEHGHLEWNGKELRLSGQLMPIADHEPLKAMVSDVLDAIEDNREPLSSGRLGLRTVAHLATLTDRHQRRGNRVRSERRDT